MALRMREVLSRRWVVVRMPLALSFEFTGNQTEGRSAFSAQPIASTCVVWSWRLKECFVLAPAVKMSLMRLCEYTGSSFSSPDGYAMLMSLKGSETAVHDCHCPSDMPLRMGEVLIRQWVGVCLPLALSLSKLLPVF